MKKIVKVDLKVLYPEYTGGCNVEPGLDFIKKKFLDTNKNQSKKVFVHVTCATDTNNIKVVFDAAREIIISQNLERLGFGQL